MSYLGKKPKLWPKHFKLTLSLQVTVEEMRHRWKSLWFPCTLNIAPFCYHITSTLAQGFGDNVPIVLEKNPILLLPLVESFKVVLHVNSKGRCPEAGKGYLRYVDEGAMEYTGGISLGALASTGPAQRSTSPADFYQEAPSLWLFPVLLDTVVPGG